MLKLSLKSAGFGTSILGLGLCLCTLFFWMSVSPDTPTQPQTQRLARPLAPVPGVDMRTESNKTISYALPGQQPSRDILQEVLDGSRLSPFWLTAHGFSTGSEALERLHELLNGHTQLSASGIANIKFGPQGSSSTSAASERPVLTTQERYVQATLQLPTGGSSEFVLVRWRNVSDNTVMELSAQAIQPSTNDAFPVWMYSAHDWPLGRYRVEVISPDPNLKLLAAGDFEIAEPNARLTPFSFEATNTLP